MKITNPVQLPQLSLRWLTCACFEIKTPEGFSIVIDPFITDSKATDLTSDVIEGADLILVSHTHYDHITDIKTLMDKFGSKVLVGDMSCMALAKWLNCNPPDIYPMYPGLELDFGGARIKALFGRHSNPHKPLSEMIEKIRTRPLVDSNMMETQLFGTVEYRNYLITLPSGLKVLFWGSNVTKEQRAIIREIKPDIALMQFTRIKPAELADMASEGGVKILIPHHMDTSKTPQVYEPLVQELYEHFISKNKNGLVICPEHGKWYRININIEVD